jgi:2-oxoglutarate ferredoxin oxidoreductase subunit beta
MWCSGCGIGTMLGALLRAFEELDYTTTDTVVVTGIGCTGKADDYMITNALHTTHGRALAYATGIKAYNPKLNVVAIMGDGDGVTIGGNHFIHACRRNIDLTAVILNNLNFGRRAARSRARPLPALHQHDGLRQPRTGLRHLCPGRGRGGQLRGPLHALPRLGDEGEHEKALTKKGFSVVEVVSPCPTHFGRHNEMKETPDMLHWLRDRATASRTIVACPRRAHRAPGHRHARVAGFPDFNTQYELVKARAQKG